MLQAVMGAHFSVMRLKAAAPNMPPGVLGTIWQTWALPQLMYGIGAWMDDTQWKDAQDLMHRCARQLLDAPAGTPNSVMMSELGWRSVSFWIKYHRYRTLSRMLRAPAGDLTHITLRDEMSLMTLRPAQSWLATTLEALAGSSLSESKMVRLKLFFQSRFQYVNFADREAVAKELDSLHLEATWCNSALHDEFEAWGHDMSGGATRALYKTFVSERRDKGPSLPPKARWATVTRPPKALRHVATKADAKLLTASRMGDRRSLTAHANPHSAALGHSCPCCSQAADTVPHMLMCPAIRGDRIQNTFPL